MKAVSLILLLAAGGPARAALARVALETSLAPVSAPSAAAAPAPMFLSAAPQFSAPIPALGAAPALSGTPAFAAAPAPALPAAAAAPAAPADDAPRATAPAGAGESISAESAAQAAEVRFDAAAAVDAERDERAPLLARLLGRVRLDDGGVPERGAALRGAFERMLESPSARALAESFVAENHSAVVRFDPSGVSRVREVGGRRVFLDQRAATSWNGAASEVTLNPSYLDADADFRDQDLPPTLAHELLGHALWYGRAAREGVQPLLHRHRLNEMNAQLVGWLVDLELDRRFADDAPWSFLADPSRYAAELELRHPYYATLFSSAELLRPIETLKARRAAAAAKRARLETALAEARARKAPRASSTEDEEDLRRRIAVVDDVIATIAAYSKALRKSPGAVARYREAAARAPFFDRLQSEVEANARRLTDSVRLLGPR